MSEQTVRKRLRNDGWPMLAQIKYHTVSHRDAINEVIDHLMETSERIGPFYIWQNPEGDFIALHLPRPHIAAEVLLLYYEALTLRQFAIKRGYSLNTVRQWQKRGKLLTEKIGRKHYVSAEQAKMFTPPSLTKNDGGVPLSEAAKLMGVATSTLRMRIRAGKLPDAYQDRRGWWMLPRSKVVSK